MPATKRKPRTSGRRNEPPLFVRQTYESPYLEPLPKQKLPTNSLNKKKVKPKKKFRTGLNNNKPTKEVLYPSSGGGGDYFISELQKDTAEQFSSICKLLEQYNSELPSDRGWEEVLVECLLSQNLAIDINMADENKPEEVPMEPDDVPAPTPAADKTAEPSIASTDKEADKEVASVRSVQAGEESKEKPKGEPEPSKEVMEEFPLGDSQVMAELKEADAQAQRTAQIIEAMKEELAALAKKDNLTNEDAKMIERKQAELMEKLSEFEEITTQVQKLVGLTEITSKMIVEQKAARHRLPSQEPIPEESLPKVIVCGGGGGVDPVPKIIVCEPSNRQGCGQPLYQQLSGRSRGASGSKKQEKPCKAMTNECPPQMKNVNQPQQANPCQQQMHPWDYRADACPQGFSWQPQQQVFPAGPMGAWPPPSTGMEDTGYNQQTCNRMVIKISTPLSCSPNSTSSSTATQDSDDNGRKTKSGKKKVQQSSQDKTCDDMKKKMETLEKQMKTIKDENVQLKNELGAGKTIELCKNELAFKQMCKADIYKQMGLPLPKSYIQGDQCRDFQQSMGFQNLGQSTTGPKSLCKARLSAGGLGKSDYPGENTVCKEKFAREMNASTTEKCKKIPQDMEGMVHKMEEEVRAIQKELQMVQAERKGLELQKKLLTCTAAAPVKPGAGGDQRGGIDFKCPPAGGSIVPLPGIVQPVPLPSGGAKVICPPTAGDCVQQETIEQPLCQKQTAQMVSTTSNPALKVLGPPMPSPHPSPPCVVALEAQLSSMREQYKKLQCDFNCKVEEVSIIRCELESAKRESLSSLKKCEEAESRVDDLLERLRAVENEKNSMSGSKDHMIEVEQQLTLSKQRYRESQEELEECKTNYQETCAALEEYRNKYLNAQQTVEEQRRQLDVMEIENNRISEHINLEIKRVKAQFQEKLEELTPLPEMLKHSHQKLHECQQMRGLAERSVEQMNKEMNELKAEKARLMKQLDDYKKGNTANDAARANLQSSLNNGEKKLEEIKSENVKLRSTVARLEELALAKDRRLDEKAHETIQLSTQLETLREESARQVSRTKDRCESVRRSLQTQISDLERQLAQSRAAARTAQMDRDEIRAKMQTQIQCLNENFNQAQLRIRSLQTNVNYLKNSYTNIFAPDRPIGPLPLDICGQAP